MEVIEGVELEEVEKEIVDHRSDNIATREGEDEVEVEAIS